MRAETSRGIPKTWMIHLTIVSLQWLMYLAWYVDATSQNGLGYASSSARDPKRTD